MTRIENEILRQFLSQQSSIFTQLINSVTSMVFQKQQKNLSNLSYPHPKRGYPPQFYGGCPIKIEFYLFSRVEKGGIPDASINTERFFHPWLSNPETRIFVFCRIFFFWENLFFVHFLRSNLFLSFRGFCFFRFQLLFQFLFQYLVFLDSFFLFWFFLVFSSNFFLLQKRPKKIIFSNFGTSFIYLNTGIPSRFFRYYSTKDHTANFILF